MTEIRETSLEALERIKSVAGSLRKKIYLLLEDGRGYTDEEQQILLGIPGNTQRPRRRELEQSGYVYAFGTRKTQSGREALIWFPK